MASTYTGLGVQLMTTGEKAGTWGTLTNTNWNIMEQIAGGYIEVDINGGAQTTTLSVNDGTAGAALAHRVVKFTGAITPADQVMGLTGVSATTTLGTATIDTSLSLTLTGQSAATAIGDPTVTSNPTVQPVGVSATTAVGSVVTVIGVPLTGVAATSSVGSITISTYTAVELTGQSATITLGNLGIQHFQDIDTGSNTSYSNVATGDNTTYTDVDTEAA